MKKFHVHFQRKMCREYVKKWQRFHNAIVTKMK